MAFPRLGSSVRVAAPFVLPFVLPVALLAAGCGAETHKEPNADQVGNMLLDQISKMIVATSTTDNKVTDDLFDKYVSCGNGKVKITYSVSGRPTTYAMGTVVANTSVKRTATPKQIIDDLTRFAPQVGDFVVRRSADGATVRLVDAKTHTKLTLYSPAKDRLVVSGETDCLRPGNLNRWPSATPRAR